VLLINGTLYGCGVNDEGQLGMGNNEGNYRQFMRIKIPSKPAIMRLFSHNAHMVNKMSILNALTTRIKVLAQEESTNITSEQIKEFKDYCIDQYGDQIDYTLQVDIQSLTIQNLTAFQEQLARRIAQLKKANPVEINPCKNLK